MRLSMISRMSCWCVVLVIVLKGSLFAQERTAAVKDELREQYRQGNQVRSGVLHQSEPVRSNGTNDVLVNNNNGSTGTSNFTQSETDIVAFGNNNVVIAFNDAGSFATGNRFTGWSYSTDGGVTFIDGGTLPVSTIGDAGDPVLARNETTGRIYFSTLGFSSPGTIQMWRSDNNGVTWMAPVVATPGGSSEDKQWHTVDNFPGTGNGNVYMMSRRFGGGPGIYVFRSTDHGDTFGPSGGTLIVSGNQGAFISVGPDHSVYAFWYTTGAIMMRKSTDLGVTFGSPITVASGLVGGVNGDLGLTGRRQGLGTFSGFRSSEFPHAGINPVSGNIYVTYANDGVGSDKADVFFVQSTNGGATWSAPVKINDDATTTDQWMPTIAVTPSGDQVGIFYYSRQEDPDSNNRFKYYGRIGNISGSTVTFNPSFAVSDVASLPEFGRDAPIVPTYMGDYNHAVATSSAFHVVWADNRDDLPGGAPRKDPNVYYERIPTTENFGWVKGTITNAIGGATLSGVNVDFTEAIPQVPSISNAAGFYKSGAKVDTPGTTVNVTLRARKFGFLDSLIAVTLTRNDTLTRNFAMSPYDLVLTRNEITFPTTPVPGSRQDSLVARNQYTTALTLSSLTTTNPDFAVSPTSGSIPGGDSLKIYVTYTPSAEGSDTGRVIIMSNSVFTPRADVILSGTAIGVPFFTASVDSLSKTLDGGTIDSISFQTRNEGTGSGNFNARAIMFPRTVAPGRTAQPITIPMNVRLERTTSSVASRGIVPQWGSSIVSEKPTVNVTAPTYGSSSSQMAERSPFRGSVTFPVLQNPHDLFDLQFDYDAVAVTGAAGNAGAIFIPALNEFWTSRWASNVLHRWTANGTMIEQFTIAGVTGVRGFTYDGQYLYASTNSATIYQIDPVAKTLVGSIICQGGVTTRMITYDPVRDAFWTSNFAGNISAVNRSGAVIATITSTLVAKYGSAYDPYTPGGPYLWVWDQTNTTGGPPQPIYQVDLNTLTYTGFNFDILTRVTTGGATPIAGGLFIATDLVPGKVTIGGMLQGVPDRLFGLELGNAGPPWLSIAPTSGTIAVDDSVRMVATFDATDPAIYEDPGDYFGSIEVRATNSPLADTLRIPAHMFVVPSDTGVLVVQPDSLNFGNVRIGTSDTMSFRVKNVGAATVNVTNINITDPNFTASPTNFTLAFQETLRVNVVFNAPFPAAQYSGTLSFVSNAGSAQTVGLGGTSFGVPDFQVRVDTLVKVLDGGARDSTLFYMRNDGTGTGDFSARAVMFQQSGPNEATGRPIVFPVIVRNVKALAIPQPQVLGTLFEGFDQSSRKGTDTPAASGGEPQHYNFNTTGGANSFPFNQPAGKMVQWLVAPGEFNQPAPAPQGRITNLYFRMAQNLGPVTYTNMHIALGQTSLISLPSGTFYSGPMDTVYNRASVTHSATMGTWLVIALDTPFPYDPALSLVVQVGQCSAPGVTGFSLAHTNLTGNRRSWSVGGCPFTFSSSGVNVLNCGIDISGGTWLSIAPMSGTVAVADSALMTAGFDATDPEIYENPGTYYGQIEVRATNSTLADTLRVPARLVVQPADTGILVVQPDSLNFGTVPIGTGRTLSFRVRNIGAQSVTVTNINITDTNFTPSPTNFTLAFQETLRVNVTFDAPFPAAQYSGTLSFVSNAGSAQTVRVVGTSIGVPHFDDRVDSLVTTLEAGFRDSILFYMRNDGTGSGNFSARAIMYPQASANGVVSQPIIVPMVVEKVNTSKIVPRRMTNADVSPFIGSTMLPLSTATPLQQLPEMLYYKFNESGTATENFASPGVGTNPAPVLGLTMGGSGQFGGALIGNGGASSTNYVNTGWNTALGNGSWTISMWLNSLPVNTTLYYLFGDNTAGSFRSFLGGAAGAGNVTLRATGLTDAIVTGVGPGPTVVTYVYDASANQVRGYKNGVLAVTVTATLNINGTAPLKVGGYSTSVGLPAGGLMDEFRMYNRALSAAEIGATWNAELGGTWLSIAPTAGTIAVGDSTLMRARFDATDPEIIGNPGNYYGRVEVVATNSPFADTLQIPVRMLVTPSTTPFITVTAPNGGEQWLVGQTYQITWVKNLVDSVKIEYSTTGSGGPWTTIVGSWPARPIAIPHPKLDSKNVPGGITTIMGTYNWVIPSAQSTNCFVRVSDKTDSSVFDASNAAFTIAVTLPDTTWTVQTSPTTQTLYSVKAVTPNIGWAGGGGGVVIRTTNGTNWTLTSPTSADPIYTITAIDANTAMAGSYSTSFAKIWRTTNGGTTWTVVDSIAGGFPNSVHLFDANNAYWQGDPVGGNWELRRTTNGGATWANADTLPGPAEAGWNNSMQWLNSTTGWFGTNAGHIYRTTDGGSSWVQATHPSVNSYSIWFNGLTAGVLGGGSTTNRSTDAGVTWTASGAITGNVLGIAGRVNTQEFWATPGNATVTFSANGGVSWSTAPPNGYSGTGTLYHVNFVTVGNNLYGWAVGPGGIRRFVRTGPVSVGDTPEGPTVFALNQNYPNPFNPVTTIKYALPVQSTVALRVFNILGQEVALLVNGERGQGYYQVVWDGKNQNGAQIASGIYFFRIDAVPTNGGSTFTQIKKMIMLK